MEDGINIDPNTLIQVLQNKLAQSAIREAQLEAALQSLMAQIPDNVPMEGTRESSSDESEQG